MRVDEEIGSYTVMALVRIPTDILTPEHAREDRASDVLGCVELATVCSIQAARTIAPAAALCLAELYLC